MATAAWALTIEVNAVDGKIITTLPLAGRSDGATFNPNAMEVFSSHGQWHSERDQGNSPMEFVVGETVQTKMGGKICTLDTMTDHVIVITREPAPAPGGTAPVKAPAAPTEADAQGEQRGGGRRGGRGGGGPQLLDVMFIGRYVAAFGTRIILARFKAP